LIAGAAVYPGGRMGTVSKELADRLVSLNGRYPGDPPVLRIVEYTNMAGQLAYGIEYRGEVGKYTSEPDNPYIGNPRVYWRRSK
jgi:hypothetical protein